nr:MAG TPA: hypothetical protein [Caudoviricetes sp.]
MAEKIFSLPLCFPLRVCTCSSHLLYLSHSHKIYEKHKFHSC